MASARTVVDSRKGTTKRHLKRGDGRLILVYKMSGQKQLWGQVIQTIDHHTRHQYCRSVRPTSDRRNRRSQERTSRRTAINDGTRRPVGGPRLGGKPTRYGGLLLKRPRSMVV